MFTLVWTEPFEAVEGWIKRETLLEEWVLEPDGLPTQLRQREGVFWLSFPALGAIQFDLISPSIAAYPKEGVDRTRFESFFLRAYLPLIFQARGIQVLHASAAVHLATGKAVAFSGHAGAGKSTLGYGLGRLPGWQQLADECLAIAVEGEQVRLTPIPNFVRLRKASQEHYVHDPGDQQRLAWPEGDLHLGCVVFLEDNGQGDSGAGSSYFLTPLSGAESYPLFLQQAFALTIKLHEQNRGLMHDYLVIARQVRAYRLRFSKSFSQLDDILDSVQGLVP